MNSTISTILTLSIVFGAILISRYMRHKMKMMEMNLRAEKDISGSFKVELEEIKKRLAALEVIVTDKGYQINDEINKL